MVALLVLWALAGTSTHPPVSPPYSELHAALIAEIGLPQSLGGRLSGFGDDVYSEGPPAPLRPQGALAFAGSGPLALTAELLRLEAALERRLGETATAGDLATAGALELLKGRADKAVELLQRAREAAPYDARVVADLAAAQLELAHHGGAPHLLPEALESALGAVELNPVSPEATYNAGMLLEQLGLWNEARKAWTRYLEVDRTSRWTPLAVDHLERLDGLLGDAEQVDLSVRPDGRLAYANGQLEQLVASEPYSARRLAEEELFPGWAEAFQNSEQAEARQWLQSARRLGKLLKRVQEDSLVQDSLGVIDEALQREDATRLSQLSMAHATYAEGLDTVLHEGCASKRAPLPRAARALSAAGSPFVGWSSVQLSICHYYRQAYADAWRELASAARIAEGGSYPALEGRILWISGLVAMVEGDLVRSLTLYRQAVEKFLRCGEKQHVAYLRALIAKDLRLLGADREAWVELVPALLARSSIPGVDRRFTVLYEAANTLETQRHPRSAIAFGNELLFESRRAAAKSDQDLHIFARVARAEVLLELRRTEEAQEDLHRAEQALKEMPADHQLIGRVEVAGAVARALLNAEHAPAFAIETLDRAIDTFAGSGEKAGERIEWTKVHLEKGKLLQRLGRLTEAESSLDAVIGELERLRDVPADPALRIEFEKRVGQIYEAMIELQLSQGKPEAALSYVDRSRLWEVAGHLGGDFYASLGTRQSFGPLSAGRLPADTVVLVYGLFEDFLALWLIDSTSFELVRRPIRRFDLERRVSDFRNAVVVGGGTLELERQAMELHRLLIPAKLRSRGAVRRIHLVPSSELLSLPFSALLDPDSRNYLIQDYELIQSYTLTPIHHRLPATRQAAIDAGIDVLVVNPSFDREKHVQFQSLRGTITTAKALRQLMPNATLLTGEEATKARVLAALREASRLYFAGHATLGVGGVRGELILAVTVPPGSARSDVIGAAEILEATKARGLEMVFLDACRTGVDAEDVGNNLGGLGGLLVSAGVPEVVATLWDIEDSEGSLLAQQLFDHILSGLPSSKAVREVSAARIQSSTEGAGLRPWAALSIFATPPLLREDQK